MGNRSTTCWTWTPGVSCCGQLGGLPYLLPETELPERHRGSRVRASDEAWFKIVKAGYDRGMFTAGRDEDVPVDKRAHLITNGAGGVAKNKVQGGVTVEMQRFISILCGDFRL